MPMYCNNFELEESRDEFLLRAEPPEAFALYPNSNPGPPGPPGPGVPAGGTAGQLLVKASATDYDTEWSDPPELDAEHVTYDESEAYSDGTIGKAVSDLNSAISDIEINKADVIVSSASGAIASFSDGMNAPIKSLEVDIEPAQDLRGYDNPWPAGGGINKWNPDTTSKEWVTPQNVIGEVSTARSMRFSCTQGTVVTLSNDNDSSASNVLMLTFLGENSAILSRNVMPSGAKYISRTAVANTVEVLASFYTYAEASKPQLEFGVSTPTAWTPFSNICPISGWTGAKINDTNGNLFDPTANPTKFIDASGAVVVNGQTSRTTDPIYINTEITKAWLKSSRAVGALCIASYDKNNNLLLRTASLGVLSLYQDIPNGTAYVRFAKYGVTGDECDLCANFGASATAGFPAYSLSTVPVSWQTQAGTVYQGSFTINEDLSGTLTATHQVYTADSSNTTLEERPASTSEWIVAREANAFTGADGGKPGVYCSHFEYKFTNVDGTSHWYVSGTSVAIFVIPRSTYPTVADFVASLTGDNVLRCVVPIGTPQTYTLTPEQVGTVITTLYGQNNVWADTGEVSLDYRADTKLYIDGKLAELVAQIVNS